MERLYFLYAILKLDKFLLNNDKVFAKLKRIITE